MSYSSNGGEVDVKQWLADNKLSDIEAVLVDKSASIEELLEFNENELNDFGKDMGLDTLQRRRFVKAVLNLKTSKSSKGTSNNLQTNLSSQGNEGQLAVIVSPEEHEAIAKLNHRYDDSTKLISDLTTCDDSLNKSTLEFQENVKISFQDIRKVLLGKKEDLLKLVEATKTEKRSKLTTQLDSLTRYSKVLSDGKEKCESLMNNKSLDLLKRKANVYSTVETLLHESNFLLEMSTQPKIAFPISEKQTQTFLEGLAIDDCDQPFPPTLTIKKLTYNFASIEWKVNENQVDFQKSDEKRVVEFALEHAKLPKDKYRLVKVKQEKENEEKTESDGKDQKDSKEKAKSEDEDEDDEDEEEEDKEKKDKSDDSEEDSDEDEEKEKKKEDDDSDDSDDGEKKKKKKKNKKKKGKKNKKDQKQFDLEILGTIDFETLPWEQRFLKVKKHFEKTDTEFSDKVKKLKDLTAYAIRIKARNGSGWGLYCEPQTFSTPKITIESKILKDKEKAWFMTKILPKNLQKKKFKLLFRASRDGFSIYSFHQKCDSKGATVLIFESTLKHVFGGYTSLPWNGNSSYQSDVKAFLFLLRSTRKNAPLKWPVKSGGTNAIYCASSYGPTFGGGHDLYICDNCNTSSSNYSNLGHSYEAPSDQSMLAGAYNFMVKDYEVFQVV